MNNNSLERTLSIIKPDAVERELEIKIKKIFLDNKLNIVDSKKIKISKEEAEEFYKVHQTKPFYEKLCSYLSSGPIIVIILDGENAIQKNRDLMGATDPKKAKDNTIRISPLKLVSVAKLIVNLKADKDITQLKFSQK